MKPTQNISDPASIRNRAQANALLKSQQPHCHRCGATLPARRARRQCGWSIAPKCEYERRQRLLEEEMAE